MPITSFSSTSGLSKSALMKSFYFDEFVFSQNYIKYLAFQTEILRNEASLLRDELKGLPDIDELVVWRYISFASTAQKLFDDTAVLIVNLAQRDLKDLSDGIFEDKSSPAAFYRRGNKNSNIGLWERKKMLSKALGIHGAEQSMQFKNLTSEDQRKFKSIMKESLDFTHQFVKAVEKVERLHADLRNKYIHAPGHLLTNLSAVDGVPYKLIGVSKTIKGRKHNRKSIPLSMDMFEVLCTAVDSTVTLSRSIIGHTSFRIRTFDKVEIPTHLPNIQAPQSEEFDRIGQLALKHIKLADVTMHAEVTMRKKRDSFFDNPAAIWNKTFEGVQKKYPSR